MQTIDHSPTVADMLGEGRRKLTAAHEAEKRSIAEKEAVQRQASEEHWTELMIAAQETLGGEVFAHVCTARPERFIGGENILGSITTVWDVEINVSGLAPVLAHFVFSNLGWILNNYAGVRSGRRDSPFAVPTQAIWTGDCADDVGIGPAAPDAWRYSLTIPEALAHAEEVESERLKLLAEVETKKAERRERYARIDVKRKDAPTTEDRLLSALRDVVREMLPETE